MRRTCPPITTLGYALVIAILAATVLTPPRASAKPFITWEQLNPMPQNNDLMRVTFTGKEFVAVGKYGTILTSGDSVDWQLQESATEAALNGVGWGNGAYVAVGESLDGKGTIVVSVDGVTWRPVYDKPDTHLSDVTFGNGRFVAVGYQRKEAYEALILTLTDATNWAPADLFAAPHCFNRITYAGGQFVTVGDSGIIATSPDGLVWTKRDSGAEGTLWTVAYGNGVYVALGDQEHARRGLILTSPDGIQWTEQTVGTLHLFRDVAFAGGQFVAVCADGVSATSRDGITWSVGKTDPDKQLVSLAYGENKHVTVGADGTILSSKDARTWESRLLGTTASLSDTAYGNNRFVIVGSKGTVLVSTDGHTLTQGNIEAGWWLLRVAYADGLFVAVGFDGTSFSSFTSADGLKWNGPYYIAPYGGDTVTRILRWRAQFAVFVPERNTAYASADGVSWKTLPVSVSAGRISDAAALGDLLIVCGPMWAPPGVKKTQGTMGGFIATSADGAAWHLAYSGPSCTYRLASGGGKALSGDGLELWSADGLKWSATQGATKTGIRASLLTYAGGWFLVSGGSGAPGQVDVAISRNGIQWTSIYPGKGRYLTSIAYGNGRFVGTGRNSAVLSLTLPNSTFLDVPDTDPSHHAVELLASKNIVAGFEDGLFHPQRNVTRAEFAKMLITALGLVPGPSASLNFSDVAGHWSAEQGFLQTAVSAGFICGYPDGTFHPDKAVTRAEAVKMVAAAASLQPQGLPVYPDVSAGDWYAGLVSSACAKGLIGASCRFAVWKDTFEGHKACTRIEAALVLGNLLSGR